MKYVIKKGQCLDILKMNVKSFTFSSTHHIRDGRHDSEMHFTDIHSIFQRTGLVASKVDNWKTVSNTSSKKQILNRA
jgi:hypothetical protein